MTHQSKLVEITSAIKEIVYHLAREDYDYLEESGAIGNDSARDVEDIALALADYGATLVGLPDEAFTTIREYGVAAAYTGLSINLWTVEEGESNLCLEFLVSKKPPYQVLLDNLSGCPPKLIPALQEVIHHLVSSDYAGLEAHGHLRMYGLSAATVEHMVVDYRNGGWRFGIPPDTIPVPSEDCLLIDLPANAFKEASVGHIFGEPGAWTADVHLRWADGCRTDDLTLRAEIHETLVGIDVQVMGLEVL